MPSGITRCYLPPDRDDIPAFVPAEAGTRVDLATPEAELTQLAGYIPRYTRQKTVTHPSTNRAEVG